MSETVFALLCDIADEMQSQVRDLPHSITKLALEALVDRLDVVIDATLGLEVPTPADDDAGEHD